MGTLSAAITVTRATLFGGRRMHSLEVRNEMMVGFRIPRLPRAFIVAVSLAACLATGTLGAGKKKKHGKALSAAEIYKRCAPAIVAIDCFGENRKPLGSASGFLVTDNGRIATDFHVIQLCQSVLVRLPNADVY